ncbi:hypothetical protein [Corallococcus exiguus]|uniref:hypothetical protein n=1 Tax=Corallococcus exiguus TaxID=83462 RepID=UPI0015612B2D|nr:hypothetical protein [Corallococcus exiguus]NRD50809.1 hypothetical protein [Corallococcus exiguus]
MRATWSLPLVLLLSAPAVAADAEDRAACRAANPGPAAKIAKAYMDCLDRIDQERAAALMAEQNRADAARRAAQELEAAQRAEQQAIERAADEQRREVELAEAAEREAELARVEAEEEAQLAALKKKCGSAYGKVRNGMAYGKRLNECAGPFVLVREDGAGQVYEAPGKGLIRVRGGKVVAWTAY